MKKVFSLLLLISSTFYIGKAQNINFKALDSLYSSKAYSELIIIAEQSLSNTDNSIYSKSKLNYILSNAYYKSNDFVRCYAYIQQSYKEVEQLALKDTSEVEIFIDVSQRLGDYSFQAEELKIGIDALDRAIKLGEEQLSNDGWRIGRLFHKAGAFYREGADMENALDRLQRGEKYLPKILSEGKRNYLSTVFLSEMAQVYNDNNELSKSIGIFKKILKDAYSNENIQRISIYNNNIGIAYERKGDYGRAEYHYKKSLEAKLELYGSNTPKLIVSNEGLGRINTKLGKHKVAQDYFKKNIEIIKEIFGDNHIKIGKSEFNIGTSFYQQKAYKKALPHFEKSLYVRMSNKSINQLIIGESEFMIGSCLVELDKAKDAIPILKKALDSRNSTDLTSEDYVQS
ncbi:MAG: tetratricopeptide repeat protein, partial [Saprospiraceae bacterium]